MSSTDVEEGGAKAGRHHDKKEKTKRSKRQEKMRVENKLGSDGEDVVAEILDNGSSSSGSEDSDGGHPTENIGIRTYIIYYLYLLCQRYALDYQIF